MPPPGPPFGQAGAGVPRPVVDRHVRAPAEHVEVRGTRVGGGRTRRADPAQAERRPCRAVPVQQVGRVVGATDERLGQIARSSRSRVGIGRGDARDGGPRRGEADRRIPRLLPDDLTALEDEEILSAGPRTPRPRRTFRCSVARERRAGATPGGEPRVRVERVAAGPALHLEVEVWGAARCVAGVADRADDVALLTSCSVRRRCSRGGRSSRRSRSASEAHPVPGDVAARGAVEGRTELGVADRAGLDGEERRPPWGEAVHAHVGAAPTAWIAERIAADAPGTVDDRKGVVTRRSGGELARRRGRVDGVGPGLGRGFEIGRRRTVIGWQLLPNGSRASTATDRASSSTLAPSSPAEDRTFRAGIRIILPEGSEVVAVDTAARPCTRPRERSGSSRFPSAGGAATRRPPAPFSRRPAASRGTVAARWRAASRQHPRSSSRTSTSTPTGGRWSGRLGP